MPELITKPVVDPQSTPVVAVAQPAAPVEFVSPAAIAPLTNRVAMQAATGTIYVDPAIYREWVSLALQTTATGGDVQSFLGWPLRIFTTRAGGSGVYFERGTILVRPDGRCFAVYGAIYIHFRELVDLEHPGPGFNIGLPIGEEEAVTNGRRSRFDAGDIYWDSRTGNAFEVHGAIRDHWEQLGGVVGFLGYPLTDETPVLDNGVETGRFNNFEGGTIYWSGASGAFEAHGAIRDDYVHAYGGPTGSLGFPLSDESDSPQGSKRYNSFQNGCITWDKNSGRIMLFTSLDVFVDSISGSGSHTFFESIGASSVWIYAYATVSTNKGYNFSQKLPATGDSYGQPNANPGTLTTIAPISGDMSIGVSLDGWDHNVSTSDTHLGTVNSQFNADNDFGLNQPQQLNDGDFHATFDLRHPSADFPYDPNFRKDFFWSFVNVGTPDLSSGQFAETFVDVGQDESPLHWFNSLFYNAVYRKVAAGGNCFGMSLESIYAEENCSLFSEPIFNTTWANAQDEVNEKQGYQLGGEHLDWYASNLLTGHFYNPVSVFYDSWAAFDRRDYPIICLTTANLSAGHCVRPCGSNPYQENGNQLIITVANPNTPGSDDSNPQNRIIIDKSANTYYFDFNGDGTNPWTGGHLTGGIISWAPFCILGHEPRTPFWEVLAAALGVSVIILGAGAQTQQITDDQNRTFYKSGLSGAPSRWEDMLLDGTQIPGMVRMPLTHQVNGHGMIPAALAANSAVAYSPLNAFGGNGLPELYQVSGLPSPYGPPPVQKVFNSIKPNGLAAAPTLARASATTAQTNLMDSAVRARALASSTQYAGAQVRLSSGPPSTIRHEVVGGSGDYDWGIRTPAGSMVVNVAGGNGAVDSVAVTDVGTVQQQLQVSLDPAGAARSVRVSLVGPVAPDPGKVRSFQISGLSLMPGQQFNAQISADGQSLNVINAGPEATFQVQAQVGFDNPSSVTKSATIASGKAAVITPQDWSNLGTGSVNMDVVPHIGGPVEQTVKL